MACKPAIGGSAGHWSRIEPLWTWPITDFRISPYSQPPGTSVGSPAQAARCSTKPLFQCWNYPNLKISTGAVCSQDGIVCRCVTRAGSHQCKTVVLTVGTFLNACHSGMENYRAPRRGSPLLALAHAAREPWLDRLKPDPPRIDAAASISRDAGAVRMIPRPVFCFRDAIRTTPGALSVTIQRAYPRFYPNDRIAAPCRRVTKDCPRYCP